MEIDVDLYKVGYFIGKYSTKLLQGVTVVRTSTAGVRLISRVAAAHRINSSDADAVYENVFECLKFID